MIEPLQVPCFIKLVTKKDLSHARVVAWYRCVEQNAPSGTVTMVHTSDNDGNPATVRLIHRTTDEGHGYLVPLTRDLRASEIDKIVHAFAEVEPKLDWDIETNETRLVAQESGEIPLDAARHAAVCTAIAKQRHEDWVRERSDAGWRYGTKFDPDNKTDPLIRPWDQLPDRFRQPDMRAAQPILDLLNAHGYVVIPQEELDHLLGHRAERVR